MARYTLTFADRGEGSGWTGFWGYYPQATMALGNRFYSIENGQLWEHNDNENPERNRIYNRTLVSRIITLLNAENAEDKIFKNLVLEGNEPWDVIMKTNLGETTLSKSEFNERESKWFAFLRQNELTEDFTDRMQGIGNVRTFTGNTVSFKSLPTLVSVGESLYQMNGGDPELIGVISEVEDVRIEVESVVNPAVVGAFCFSVKNARVQGSEIRGYFAEVELSTDSNNPVELYAVGSNAVLSHVTTEIRG